MITQLLIYSLKASMILALCYVPYMLILRRESFFRLNRTVLLAIMMLSLTLPAFNISWMSLDNVPVMHATYQQMADAGLPVQSVSIEEMPEVVAEQPAKTKWFDIIAIVFFIGMVLSILYRTVQMGVLSYILSRKNVWTKRQDDGILICCRKGEFSPYSWINRIVISESDWDENARAILLHETGHIKAKHSYDQLLLMFCQAMMWYNPFAWLLGSSLDDVHEYEADDYVLTQGVNAKSYMLLLVSKVAKWEGYSFVNSLNHSTLNKRIIMMKVSPAVSSWRRSKILYILPVCALALSVFATPKIAEPTQMALLELEQEQEEPAIANPDVAPAFGSDESDFYKFLAMNLRYPPLALEYGVGARVWMELVVNPDGTLSDIKSFCEEDGNPDGVSDVINEVKAVSYNRSTSNGNAEESAIIKEAKQSLMDEAVRVIENTSGQWTPGYMQNEDGTQTTVPVKLTFPITFRLR